MNDDEGPRSSHLKGGQMRYLLLLFISQFAFQAHSFDQEMTPGSGSTGGGYALRCENPTDNQKPLELLDFYEARVLYGFELLESSGDLAFDWLESSDHIYTLQGAPDVVENDKEFIEQNLINLMKLFEYVPDFDGLPETKDVGDTSHIPDNCKLEQVALFIDDPQKVYVKKDLWFALTTMERAALVQHEIFGHWYRMIGEQTTEFARGFVAHGFAKNPGTLRWEGVPDIKAKYSADAEDSSVYNPYGKYTSFWSYKHNGNVRLQFESLFGRGILAKTVADLPIKNLKMKKRFKDKKSSCIVSTLELDEQGEVPIQGTMAAGASLVYKIKTGFPIEIALKKDGLILSENVVQRCP